MKIECSRPYGYGIAQGLDLYVGCPPPSPPPPSFVKWGEPLCVNSVLFPGNSILGKRAKDVEDLESGFLITIFVQSPSGMPGVPIRGHSSFSTFSSTPKTTRYFCTVPSGSHWPQVAIKHLKWGQCKVRGAVGVKHTLDFKDLHERKKVNFPSRLRSTSW